MGYLQFARDNARFLMFGLLLVFCSSFGQTYFVAMFGGYIRSDLGLSHGAFGSLYSVGTALSALTLVWLGRLIDRINLRLYSTLVCAGLAAATFLMGFAESFLAVALAFFLIRLFGQGLMVHTAYTSVARAFTASRGKAISIVGLGMPIAEATLPLIAVALAVAIGWRQAWLVFGLLVAVAVVPMVRWLIRDHVEPQDGAPRQAGGGATHHAQRQWSRTEVLRDPRFYAVLTVLLAPPFIITGLFFHQAHVAQTKGWPLSLLATGFIAYGAASIVSALMAGHLVDRFGAQRLLPFMLAPLCLAMLVLATQGHAAASFLYRALAGLNAGLSVVIAGALWAELYGVVHLGSIRAMATPMMVFASALSPASLGWLFDGGVSLPAILWASIAYCMVASVLVAALFRSGDLSVRRRLDRAA